jgi:hypothetical protein
MMLEMSEMSEMSGFDLNTNREQRKPKGWQ